MKNLILPFNEKKEFNPFVLDVETQYLSTEVEGGWDSINKFKVSVAVSWDKEHDLRVWFEEDSANLIEEASKYYPIVTYNGENFDFEVLSAYGDVSKLYGSSVDILKIAKGILKFRPHLDSIAKATLGIEKTADGIQAVEWWRSGHATLRQKVIDYCKADVEITREIFFFAKEHGYLMCSNKFGRDTKFNISL
jgi:DEAD/DEAH box helicase domain-containing protein